MIVGDATDRIALLNANKPETLAECLTKPKEKLIAHLDCPLINIFQRAVISKSRFLDVYHLGRDILDLGLPEHQLIIDVLKQLQVHFLSEVEKVCEPLEGSRICEFDLLHLTFIDYLILDHEADVILFRGLLEEMLELDDRQVFCGFQWLLSAKVNRWIKIPVISTAEDFLFGSLDQYFTFVDRMLGIVKQRRII